MSFIVQPKSHTAIKNIKDKPKINEGLEKHDEKYYNEYTPTCDL